MHPTSVIHQELCVVKSIFVKLFTSCAAGVFIVRMTIRLLGTLASTATIGLVPLKIALIPLTPSALAPLASVLQAARAIVGLASPSAALVLTQRGRGGYDIIKKSRGGLRW